MTWVMRGTKENVKAGMGAGGRGIEASGYQGQFPRGQGISAEP